MKDNLFKHAMSLTVLVMFLIIAIGSTDDAAIEKDVSSQYVEEVITSQQLYNAYEANEVAADQKYKGKILLVSGEIEDIAKDITDTIYKRSTTSYSVMKGRVDLISSRSALSLLRKQFLLST